MGGYTLENLYVIPYEDDVFQHPDIFNINRAFCCAPVLCLFVAVADEFVSFCSKYLKLFCVSCSCSL